MSWIGSAARGTAKATKGYFSILIRGTKGAVGAESIHQTGQMLKSAAHRLRLRTCPRCLEQSLEEVEGGLQCIRHDICGYHGSVESVRAMSGVVQMDPRILVVAKVVNADFGHRSSGAAKVSRMMWGVCGGILLYSLYWVSMGSWYALWAMLVGVLAAVHAIRYAYMSQMLSDGAITSPKSFLAAPDKWFV